MKSKKRRQWPLLVGACVLAACVVIVIGKSPFGPVSSWNTADKDTPVAATPVPTPPPREALEFRMVNLDHGWVRYADGIAATEDGGGLWLPAAEEVAAAETAVDGSLAELLSLEEAGTTSPLRF